jgi:hypothetical protein
MKISFPAFTIFISVMMFQSCLGPDVKENEMKFTDNKITFNLVIGGKKIFGNVDRNNERRDVLLKIGDKLLTGEISQFLNKVSYSFIYNNDFVKGTVSFDANARKDRVNLEIFKKKLTGDITYKKNEAEFDLMYGEKTLLCSWTYDQADSRIIWNIDLDGRHMSVNMREKHRALEYSFSDIILDDDEIILFLSLEFLRMIR